MPGDLQGRISRKQRVAGGDVRISPQALERAFLSEGVRATDQHQCINCVAQEFHTVADHSADARLVIQLPAGDRPLVHVIGAQCLNVRTLDLERCLCRSMLDLAESACRAELV